MATDIIARGMITEYIAGTNINFTENRDGTVEISASGSISSEDSVARDAIGNHKSDTSNPHNVTPAQIGLGNVDNTSDLDKPISTAVQKAIDNKADKTVATTSADGLMSAEDKGKLDAFEITTTGGKLHDKDIATTDLIPTELPANGGTADTARQVISLSSKVRLYEDNEGGNLELVSPDGVHSMQMDLFNNTSFRMYFDGGDGIVSPLNYDFATKKLNINGNSQTVNGHTVEADVPADAVFTDTVPDLTPYALKSLYGDTTINVGRRENAPVGEYSTSLGIGTVANGNASTAEGSGSQAAGYASHAGGYNCQASNNYSFAHGYEVRAKHEYETAFGKHNVSNDDTLFSIGDGSEINTDGNISIAYHNAFEITKTGGKLHDKDILTSAHCIQFIPYNMKYFALNDRLLLFSNDDAVARGIYFVNNTPNDIVVCALISASAASPAVQYGYGSNTYPEIQNTGEGREWFSAESIQTSPTIFTMTVPSGKLGYYGVYHNSETAYTTIHDIRCPYFNFF